MQEFTDAIRKSIQNKNWFASLFLVLCMPDVCATIEDPSNNEVKERYTKWFDENLASIYSPDFSADDCYYFRCGCLHQSLDNHNKLTYDRIHFIIPPPNGNIIHRNIIKNILQMQVDVFCEDVAKAVESWFENVVRKDIDMMLRVKDLIKIYDLDSLAPFIVFNV